MNFTWRIVLAASFAAALGACSKSGSQPTPLTGTPAARHEHHPPHGGTAIVLGNEAYHLELVVDSVAGRLSAYVLDGEMENFIRVNAASFEVIANGGDEKRILTFCAIANPATGETIGDTSQFEAQADWLKAVATFDASLRSLDIRGTTFSAVAFNFPRGNDRN
jgi:hypothetical protein